MAIGYSDIAAVQAGGVNTLDALNDPNFDFGNLKLITATYTMTGNEALNDQIYIARVPQGALVDPSSSCASNGIASAATITVGDSDTWGGTRSYDPSRYSGSIDPHVASTTPVAFASGTVLAAPAEIQDDWVWLIATFATMTSPTAGRKLVFRIKVSALD